MSRSLSTIPEWRSLSAERDPELRAEGFLSLAGRLEARGEEEPAAEIYASLANPQDGEISRRARERLEGLTGGGTFGTRAEIFLRRFVGHSADPSA
ncbi:MAG TPA: hypothetical protein VJP40_02510, partial [bacterium]|nr:hypothetical protein [bacterium]